MNTLLGHTLKPTPYANGGRVTPGMAALKRLTSQRSAADYAQGVLDDINKKSGKSSFWGSVLGLGGSVALPFLGAALGIGTGGLAVPLLAGAGAGIGSYLGKKKGYGKDVSIDENMRYGGSDFLGQAGLDKQVAGQDTFTGNFLRDAAIAAGTAALTAGLTPGGGIYGKSASLGKGLSGQIGNVGTALASSTAPLATDAVTSEIANRALTSQAFQPNFISNVKGIAGNVAPVIANRALTSQAFQPISNISFGDASRVANNSNLLDMMMQYYDMDEAGTQRYLEQG